MKNRKHLILMLVLGMLFIAGCSGEETVQMDPSSDGEPAAIEKLSDEERLNAAIDQLKKAKSYHQTAQYDVNMTFSDEMLEADDNEFVAQMIAMMSTIKMGIDMAVENYDYEQPLENPDLKISGNMDIQMGEMAFKVLMYIKDQRIYMDDGTNGLLYTSLESNEDSVDQNMFDTGFYMLDEFETENITGEAVQLESAEGMMEATKYTFDNTMQIIEDILASDATFGDLVDEESENPLEGIDFEQMAYNLYINQDNEIVKIEIFFRMTLPEMVEMTGIEAVDYQIDIWVEGINETRVEFPDLSGAVEQSAE